ncbi:protein kinase family protein [Virgibacillus sp. MSP4-1]|uniref:protein kinase family protein n=1 Tax=Virgibacillus sp. MSP4-1 TaxID=2700081 RepID=UPI0005C4E2C9|nr:protein kinase family protein [Virgibacillus sp. MSP4-1]QHS23196.1 protein kinase family protein [Virgibacillus sp. MSP4-1]
MKPIGDLVEKVTFHKTRIRSHPDELILIGKGRSAAVFKVANTNKAVKIFYPSCEDLAKQEISIYRQLNNDQYFPAIYGEGGNYFVLEYLSGITFYECLCQGIEITPEMVKRVDQAMNFAKSKGLNPSDTHLKNIILTCHGQVKLIDVARFKQTKECRQWEDLKATYQRFYRLKYFPKKFPKLIIEMIVRLYRYKLLPQSIF